MTNRYIFSHWLDLDEPLKMLSVIAVSRYIPGLLGTTITHDRTPMKTSTNLACRDRGICHGSNHGW